MLTLKSDMEEFCISTVTIGDEFISLINSSVEQTVSDISHSKLCDNSDSSALLDHYAFSCANINEAEGVEFIISGYSNGGWWHAKLIVMPHNCSAGMLPYSYASI